MEKNFFDSSLLRIKLGCTWMVKGFEMSRGGGVGGEWTKMFAGNYFEEGIKKLILRFTTCIERNNDYVEK